MSHRRPLNYPQDLSLDIHLHVVVVALPSLPGHHRPDKVAGPRVINNKLLNISKTGVYKPVVFVVIPPALFAAAITRRNRVVVVVH